MCRADQYSWELLSVKGTLARDFRHSFLFHQKQAPGPLIRPLNYFFSSSNINSNSPRIWRSFRVLSEYAERNYFVMLGPNNRSFLVAIRSTCTRTYFLLKYYPFKSCNEYDSIPNIQNYLGAFSEYAEWICTYTENTRNESVRILRIHGKNLYVFWE